LEGISTVALLLPAVLSLVPGLVKGCLLVNTLVPQSLLPGWLIVMAAPLYGLFLLAIFASSQCANVACVSGTKGH
jgi:hypothetical protein